MLRASCHTLVGAPPVCSTAVAGSPLRWERCSEDTSLIFPFARMESCRKSIDKGLIRRVTYRSSRSRPLRAGRRRTKTSCPTRSTFCRRLRSLPAGWSAPARAGSQRTDRSPGQRRLAERVPRLGPGAVVGRGRRRASGSSRERGSETWVGLRLNSKMFCWAIRWSSGSRQALRGTGGTVRPLRPHHGVLGSSVQFSGGVRLNSGVAHQPGTS